MVGPIGRSLCVTASWAVLLFALPALAQAPGETPPRQGPLAGPYFSVGGGFSHLERSFSHGGGAAFEQTHDAGALAFGAAGYRLGPMRFEAEFSYRGNDGDGIRRGRDLRRGETDAYAFMVNGVFEPFPDWRLSPYVGAGVGGAVLDIDGPSYQRAGQDVRVTEDTEAEFAYQAIAGARMNLNRNWSVHADYRYLATLDPDYTVRRAGQRGSVEGEYKSHALMVGVSYHFGETEPEAKDDKRQRLARDLAARGYDRAAADVLTGREPSREVVAPQPQQAVVLEPSPPTPRPQTLTPQSAPPPAPASAGRAAPPDPTPLGRSQSGTPRPLQPVTIPTRRSSREEGAYIVYFAFDSARLSNEAIRTIDRAAVDYRARGEAKIMVDGHADRAGSDWYNDELSLRRARAVAAQLEARGVGRDEIGVRAFGKREPRVPTADGVREQRNRRVEIFVRE